MQYSTIRYLVTFLGACLCALSAEARGLIDQRDAYLSANGRSWQVGWSAKNPSGSYIGWGEASINTPPADVRHGQARVLERHPGEPELLCRQRRPRAR